MSWKRFTILTISVFALFSIYKLVQACADIGDPYDEYPSFFSPDAAAKPVYTPYFYQSSLKYYDDWYDAPKADTLPDANIGEWYRYCGGKVPELDLDALIYVYSYADLKALYSHLEQGAPLNISQDKADNGFTKWLSQNKDLEALGYLMHAKQCEPFAANSDDWEAKPKDTARMSRLMKNGLQLYAAAKKDFIKQRYAFQVVRMAFYAGKNAEALALYDQLAGVGKATTYTQARTLALKAGALFRLKRKAEAAYNYSLVFDFADQLKTSAYQSFDWAVGQDISGVLKLCKTPHERAVVALMDGLHNYEFGLVNMKAAYEADPQIEGLEVLMSREINKLEERYQQPVLYQERNVSASSFYYNNPIIRPGTDEYKKQSEEKQKYQAYIDELNAFARRMAADGHQPHPAFWQLSAAYLYFMRGDIKGYEQQLAAAKRSRMDAKEQDLLDVLEVLYVIRSHPSLTPEVEAQLLPRLRALQQRKNAKAYRDVMGTLITTAYLRQQDTLKAIFALGKTSATQDISFIDLPGSLLEAMSPTQLETVIGFVQKGGNSAYDRWLLDSTTYTADRLTELEGTKYLRLHQFAKAASVLQKVSPAMLERTTLPDPFVAHMSDRIELDRTDTGKWYNKLTFAKSMVALEAKMGTDAGAQFDYGVGLFSMTHYGKASAAYTYYRSSVDGLAYFSSPERLALPAYAQEYYSAWKAEQAFVKAAALATEPSLKAKSLFMAARCWEKRCPGTAEGYYYNEAELKDYYANALRNPYFRQVKEGFGNTPFYQRAISTCSYFADYVKQKK